MAVLVVGGAGFVGSHVCKALARDGVRPVVLDDLSTGYREFVRWGPLVEADMANGEAVSQAVAEHGINAAIILAGFIAAGESVTSPAKYYDTNVGKCIALLDTLRQAGVDTVIFSSSAAVYGTPDRVPVTEDAAIHPESPYGHSKRMIEQVLADFGTAYGMHSLALRYFNAAGSDPDGEVGECHHPETHLIPLVLDAALGRRADVRVFGTDYPTPDGTCIRDYVHVSDLAAAHVLGLRRLLARDATPPALNLGSETGFSVRQVIATIEAVTGLRVPVVDAPRRPGDPSVLVASSALARSCLGWTPAYPSLTDQVAHAWTWRKGASCA